MAEWSTTTKHEPSSINGGRKYENRDRLSIEQLNNMTENAFYAMAKSDEAKAESASAKQVADEALAQAQTTGTRVLVNGSFVTEFDSNTKAEKSVVNEIQQQVNDLETTKAQVDASNLTDENIGSWNTKLGINEKASKTELNTLSLIPSNSGHISISVTNNVEIQYTAPINGWVVLIGSSAGEGTMRARLMTGGNTGDTCKLCVSDTTSVRNAAIYTSLPCKKGDVIYITPRNMTELVCKFVPAEEV